MSTNLWSPARINCLLSRDLAASSSVTSEFVLGLRPLSHPQTGFIFTGAGSPTTHGDSEKPQLVPSDVTGLGLRGPADRGRPPHEGLFLHYLDDGWGGLPTRDFSYITSTIGGEASPLETSYITSTTGGEASPLGTVPTLPQRRVGRPPRYDCPYDTSTMDGEASPPTAGRKRHANN